MKEETKLRERPQISATKYRRTNVHLADRWTLVSRFSGRFLADLWTFVSRFFADFSPISRRFLADLWAFVRRLFADC